MSASEENDGKTAETDSVKLEIGNDDEPTADAVKGGQGFGQIQPYIYSGEHIQVKAKYILPKKLKHLLYLSIC